MVFFLDLAVYIAPKFGATVIAVWVLFRILKALYQSLFPVAFERFMVKYNREMEETKRELFWDLDFLKKKMDNDLTVLEIGAGTGANFKFYPEGTSVIPLDQSGKFNKYVQEHAKEFPHVKVEKSVLLHGESMRDVPDESVDVVVATMILCSVGDVDKFLQETKRVLKPQGKFYYLEHIAGTKDTTWIRQLQRLVNPVWSAVAEGCSVNKDTWKNINKAGFSRVEYNKFMAPLPSKYHILRPHLVGHAVK